MGALSATGQPAKRAAFESLLTPVTFVPPGDVDALEAAVGPDTGLILLEVIQGEGGVRPLPPEFIKAAAALEPLLCIDEIRNGSSDWRSSPSSIGALLPRDARPGARQRPPIGCLLVAEQATGAFVPGDHGSTFGGNPVSCAAACAVVDAVDEGLLANVREQGARLRAGLSVLPGVTEVRGAGLLVGADVASPAADVTVAAALEQGLVVLTAGEHVLRLAPPLVVGVEEVDHALTVLEEVLG